MSIADTVADLLLRAQAAAKARAEAEAAAHASISSIHKDGEIFGDAWVAGPLDPALLAREITIGFGTGEHDYKWSNRRLTVKQLTEFLCEWQRGPKDGACILQGAIAEAGVTPKDLGRRLASSMSKNELAGYDIDSGHTLAELQEKIPAGTFAILWSTHSHGKVRSFVSEKTVQDKLKLTNPTAPDIAAYLVKRFKAKPEIFEGATLGPLGEFGPLDKKTGKPKPGYLLTHKPWPKSRVVFVLAKPFIFGQRGGTHKDGEAEWKARYPAAAAAMGLEIDQSCNRPNSLFFTPRIAEGVETSEAGDDGLHDIIVVPGKAFDFEAVKIPPKPERKAKPTGEHQAGTSSAPTDGFKTLHMQKFLKLCGPTFRVAAWLDKIAPHDVRWVYDGEGKIDHRCPVEDQHTDPHDDDRGFYVRNGAGDAGGFQAYCPHAGCLDRAKRTDTKHDRGVMLDECCAYYDVTDATELLPYCSDEARAAWVGPFGEVPPGDKPAGGEQQQQKASIAERITPLTLTDADLPGLPRRRWLAERRLIRGKVTEIVAPGGAGKSLLSLQWAIAAATHDGKFTGLVMRERVHSLIVNLEDETDEIKLRVAAVAKEFGIPFSAFTGLLHVYDDEGNGLKLLKRAPGGGLVETPAVNELIAYMLKHKIGFASFDPLVEITEAKENDNNEMAQVMSVFKRIARQTDAAISVVHHTAKPPIAASTGFAGNINASRGAGAVPNAARVGLTLFSMSDADAERLKVPDRQRYVRLDDGKANLYLASDKEEWFRRVTVTLPNGEEVGVLQPAELGLSQRDIEIRGMLVAFIRHRELLGEPLPTSTPRALRRRLCLHL